jgi:hypothetical protein
MTLQAVAPNNAMQRKDKVPTYIAARSWSKILSFIKKFRAVRRRGASICILATISHKAPRREKGLMVSFLGKKPEVRSRLVKAELKHGQFFLMHAILIFSLDRLLFKPVILSSPC